MHVDIFQLFPISEYQMYFPQVQVFFLLCPGSSKPKPSSQVAAVLHFKGVDPDVKTKDRFMLSFKIRSALRPTDKYIYIHCKIVQAPKTKLLCSENAVLQMFEYFNIHLLYIPVAIQHK